MNSSEVDAAAPAKRSPIRRFTEQRWLIPVLLVLASILVGVVHVPQHQTLSPIDEYVYTDYFDKVLTQGIVRQGEDVGDFARRELGCRGLRVLQPAADARCTYASSILDDDGLFPMAGKTSADIYTPLYFAVTRVLAEPLIWSGAIDSPLQAGRFVGVVWIAAAALLFFLVLRRLRIPPWIAGGTSLLIVGSLPAYWYATYLSTDAPTMFVGSALLYLLVRGLQGASSLWWLVAAAPLAIWFKFQNFAAIGAIALTLVFIAISEAVRERAGFSGFVKNRKVLVAVSAGAAALAAQLLWMTVRAALTISITPDQGTSERLDLNTMLALVSRFLGSTGNGIGFPVGAAIIVQVAAQWIAIAGVVGLAATARPGSRRASFAYAVLLMAMLLGPLLALSVRLSTGYYFALPERYGLSLFPMFLTAAALLVRERRASAIVLASIGVVSYVASLFVIE